MMNRPYVSPHPKGSGIDIIFDEGNAELRPPERDTDPATIIWSTDGKPRNIKVSMQDTHILSLAICSYPTLADVCAAIIEAEVEAS